MEAGDRVICRIPNGYPFTEGKEYIVEVYEAPERDNNFTWPAYVRVTNDHGGQSWCHAHRFEVTR